MKEHIYILGSNSFSGAHFVRHALEAGYRVTGVSRSEEAHPVFLPYLRPDGSRPDDFTFLQADINTDMERIRERMQDDKPAYVVNFAAQGMVAESWLHPEQWLRTNALSPLALYEFLRKADWLRKFVQISTPEVYGSTRGMVRESICYDPSTPYAVSKAAADMNLRAFWKRYGFPVVFTRAANVFGPCQRLYRIVPRAVLRFLTGGVLELHGGGSSVRSFIHIRDVAEATLRAMRAGVPGEIYHVSTTRALSIRELVFRIADIVGVDAERHIRVVGERPGKDAAYLLDSSHIRKELGWQESATLEDGIADTVAWVRDNLDTLRGLPQDYEHKA